jgi:hypothetical protein
MATAVPTSSGENGGVAVPLLRVGRLTGGIGSAHASMAIARARNANRGLSCFLMVTSYKIKKQRHREYSLSVSADYAIDHFGDGILRV